MPEYLLKQCRVCDAVKPTGQFQKGDDRCKRCVLLSDKMRKAIEDAKYAIKMLKALEAINDIVYTTMTPSARVTAVKEILLGEDVVTSDCDHMRSSRAPKQEINL